MRKGGGAIFRRKKGTEEKVGKEKKKAIKKIEGTLWGYMVGERGVTGDILQNLRQVECDGVVGGKRVIMFRIFDPAAANEKGVTIDGREALDNHQELILYEGHYREIGHQATDIHMEKKTKERRSKC